MHRQSSAGSARRPASFPFASALGPLLACALLASPTHASDVGVGSLTPRSRVELGSSVTVIDREDIERRRTPFVSELLREVPGVAISRGGTFGSITQARIRGAEGNHTMVIIDGVQVNDPANNDEYDLGLLLTHDIERIEVLRGPQSALYGSEAVAGVINIVTREMPPGPFGSISGEAGSFSTYRSSAMLSAGSDRFRLTGSAGFLDTSGTSISPEGGEHDGYRNQTYNLKGQFTADPRLRFGGNLRYSRQDRESDEQDFAFPPTPTSGLVINSRDELDNEQLTGRAWGELALFDGAWRHLVEVSKSDTRQDTRDRGSALAENRGDKRRYRYQTTIERTLAGLDHVLTGAFEHEENRWSSRQFDPLLAPASQSQKVDQNSWSAEYRVAWRDRLFLSASGRSDENDLFDDADTFRITGSWIAPWRTTRLFANWGEAVQNPGMLELFGFFPDFFTGNPDLQPEESDGWELGLEQELLEGRALVTLAYFDQELNDEIDGFVFDPMLASFTADNLDGTSDREGFEASLEYRPWDDLTVAASYTYLDSERPDGEDEIRRPKHVASLNLHYRILRGRGDVDLTVLYNGEQDDLEFVPSTPEDVVELDDYTLVNVAGSYRLNDRFEVYGRIENLFDEDYQDVYGFETPGFGAYAGFRVHFGR